MKVPVFITARTKIDLVKAMIKNNANSGTEFKYFDIQKDGKEWVAWFLATPKFVREDENAS